MHTVHQSSGSRSHMPGHPGVFKNGRLHKEACTFINRGLVDKGVATNTALVAARALVAWFDFCEVIKIDWTFASEDELILFRDAHLNGVSSTTGQRYSPSTARTRMIYSCSSASSPMRRAG